MPGLGEGIPRDVEPAGACEQLVGIGTGFQKIHQPLELPWVFGADIGSLAQQVLRARHAAHTAVHVGITETAVDDDGANLAAGWLQQQVTAVGQVYYILHRGDVLRVLARVQKLAQLKVRRDADIIYLCVHGNAC